jgi:EAL and modified HD-GYP domain-containing signal transduction protein
MRPWAIGRVLAWKRRPADKKVGLLSDLLKLIQLIDRDADAAEIEAVLKRDAGLSYKLVSMSNAASYGQATQVTSLTHAIGIVGRMQLKRWLTLMLVQAGGSDTPQVLLRVAFIRAAFLEELGKSLGPEIAKEDLFLCGAFSLVDTILGIPLPELLRRISISDAITEALVGGEGPLAPLLKVIEGIESKDDGLLRAQCELLSISPADVNRALITAISSAEEVK